MWFIECYQKWKTERLHGYRMVVSVSAHAHDATTWPPDRESYCISLASKITLQNSEHSFLLYAYRFHTSQRHYIPSQTVINQGPSLTGILEKERNPHHLLSVQHKAKGFPDILWFISLNHYAGWQYYFYYTDEQLGRDRVVWLRVTMGWMCPLKRYAQVLTPGT